MGPEAPKTEELQPKFIIEDSTPTPEAPKYKMVKDAMDLFVKRDFDKSRNTFKEAQINYPTELPPAEILMTRMLIAARQPQLARAELEQCVRTNEADPEPYLYFAEAAISEGRVTDAAAVLAIGYPKLTAYKDNIFRKTNLVKRYYSINAAVAESRKKWDEAKVTLEDWIKLDPKAAAAHQRLARVLFQSNSKDPAVFKELELAAASEKTLPSPNISMAQLFESLNTDAGRAEATKYVEAAVAEDPKTNKDRVLKSFLTATQFAVATNKLTDAVKYADGALKIDPKSLEAQLTRGTIARMTRDYKTAEAQLDALYSQNPANFAVSNNLALVLAEQTEPAKKQRALELAMLTFNNNKQNQQLAVEAAATVGWTYYKAGKLAEAEQALQAVIQSNQLTPDSAYYVATVLSDRGRNADALNIVNEALKTPVFFNRVDAEKLQRKLVAAVESKDAPNK